MSEKPVRVTTREDEWDDFIGGIAVLGLILLGCIGVSAGILKVLSLRPEFGIPVGMAAWVALILKFKWMREIAIEALRIIVFFGAILLGLTLLVWAFK